MLIRLLKPLVLSPFVRQHLRRYISKPTHADLEVLKTLVESDQLKPIIDRTYALHETSAASRDIEGGRLEAKSWSGLWPIRPTTD